jgi:hypothetical protein
MSNRIGGDFNHEAVEAFRAAYAQQLQTVADLEVDERTGLPTDTISNTSPWIEHTGLWKYPSGKGPEEDLKAPFNPNDYLSDEVIDGDGEIDEMTDEEVENLVNEIVGEIDDTEQEG